MIYDGINHSVIITIELRKINTLRYIIFSSFHNQLGFAIIIVRALMLCGIPIKDLTAEAQLAVGLLMIEIYNRRISYVRFNAAEIKLIIKINRCIGILIPIIGKIDQKHRDFSLSVRGHTAGQKELGTLLHGNTNLNSLHRRSFTFFRESDQCGTKCRDQQKYRQATEQIAKLFAFHTSFFIHAVIFHFNLHSAASRRYK